MVERSPRIAPARELASARSGFEQMPGIATTVENLYSSHPSVLQL
jgi:hypothetical protein